MNEIDQTIAIAKRLTEAGPCTNLTTRLAFMRHKVEGHNAAEQLLKAVANDASNIASVCDDLDALEEILISDGTSSKFLDRLAVHSVGSARNVGTFKSLGVRTSLGLFASQVSEWVFNLGVDLLQLTKKLGVDDPVDRINFMHSKFWCDLRRALEQLEGNRRIEAVLEIANSISHKWNVTSGEDAIEELLTFKATDSPFASSPYPDEANYLRDKFIWENIVGSSAAKLQVELKSRKFSMIKSKQGFKDAALRFARHIGSETTRNFRQERPLTDAEKRS